MFMEMPKHIESAGIGNEPIAYEWDQSCEEEVLLDQPRLMSRLNKISFRGVLAFSLGVVEWVAWRLSRNLEDEIPFQVLQAVWAGMIDWRYLKSLTVPEWEAELDEPISGPLALAFRLLTDVCVEARGMSPVSQFAAPLSELPLKIISSPDGYKEWRRFAVNLLTEMYPMLEENRLGSPVPREVLEPSIDWKPDLAPQYLAAFLRSCDPGKNPYLSSPEEMIRAGFEGTPYSL